MEDDELSNVIKLINAGEIKLANEIIKGFSNPVKIWCDIINNKDLRIDPGTTHPHFKHPIFHITNLISIWDYTIASGRYYQIWFDGITPRGDICTFKVNNYMTEQACLNDVITYFIKYIDRI